MNKRLPKDYVITRVDWDLPSNQPGSRFRLDELREEYWSFFSFLQDNGLSTRKLASRKEDISGETELTVGDLTEDGMELIRTGYQRWLEALDRAGPAGRRQKAKDVTLLSKYLAKIRAQKGAIKGRK